MGSNRNVQRGRRVVEFLAALSADDRESFDLDAREQNDYEGYRRAKRRQPLAPAE